jgi:cell division septal protein FtsQ
MSPVGAPTRPSAPDPRIAARRQAVEADRRRTVRRRRAVVAGIVTALALAGWLAHSPAFDVDDVQVTGAAAQSVADVVAAAAVSPGDALIWVDGGEIADAVESLPWVATATVTRHVRDGRVVVSITERTPVAVVATVEGALLADGEGYLLAWTPIDGGLPVVQGIVPGPPGTRLEGVDRAPLALAAALPAGLSGMVAEIRAAGNGTLELVLREGGVVRLGVLDELATKLRTLQTVLDTVDLDCLATIDVSVADTAVLTRGQACA